MTVDIDKMRARRDAREAESGQGGEFIKFKGGQTLVYVHPPSAGSDEDELTDGYPYVEVVNHYKIGPNEKVVPSLVQPILQHPAVRRALADRKKGSFDPDGIESCPIAEAIRNGELDSKESRAQKRFFWGVTPMFWRAKEGDEWQPLAPAPGILIAGGTIQSGFEDSIVEAKTEYDLDVTDPEKAVFLRVTRKGEKMSTKYDVKPDPRTSRKPQKLDAKLRAQIDEAIAEGGPCNLFRTIANQFKSPEHVRAIIDGIDLEDDDGGSDERPRPAAKPAKPAARPAAKPAAPVEEAPDDELEVADGEAGGYVDADGNPCDADGNPLEPVDDVDAPADASADGDPPPDDVVPDDEPAPPPPKKPVAPAKPAARPAPTPARPAAMAKPAAAPAAGKPAVAGTKVPAAGAKPAPKPAPAASDDDLDDIEREIEALSKGKPAAKPATRPAPAPSRPAPKPAARK